MSYDERDASLHGISGVNSPKPRNLVVSVRQRLLNSARSRKEDFQLLLIRFGIERLLYRLQSSEQGRRFILKGAMLFEIWGGRSHRPTRDVDLLGRGEISTARLAHLFQEVCQSSVEDDGLIFRAETVTAEPIKEDQEYEGIRVRLQARLGNARIPLQVDIGFGDVVTPAPLEVDYPCLLDFPAPRLYVYPRETVVAEKYQAMVALGMANSRMKDFYDLCVLAKKFEFSGSVLCRAIRATFARRKTDLPQQLPVALTPEFSGDRTKATQWNAFLRKNGLTAPVASLGDVSDFLQQFLVPPTERLRGGGEWATVWQFPGGWQPP